MSAAEVAPRGESTAESKSSSNSLDTLQTQVRDLTLKCRTLERLLSEFQLENARLRHYTLCLEKQLARYVSADSCSTPISSRSLALFSSDEATPESACSFKSLWDEIVIDRIADTFAPLLPHRLGLTRTVRALAVSLQEYVRQVQAKAVSGLATALKAEEATAAVCIYPLLRQNRDAIFQVTEEQMTTLKARIQSALPKSKTASTAAKCLDSGKEFASKLASLSAELSLDWPELSFPVSGAEEPVKYNRQLHYCVDGFVKEGTDCLVVLPVPIGVSEQSASLPAEWRIKAAVVPFSREEDGSESASTADKQEESKVVIECYMRNELWRNNRHVKKMSFGTWQTRSADSRSVSESHVADHYCPNLRTIRALNGISNNK